MGNTVIIKPYVFDLLAYLISLGLGLDLAITGVRLLTSQKGAHIKPNLLGLRVIYWVQSAMDKWKGDNKFVRLFYDTRTMALYFLVGGVLLVIAGLIMIFEVLKQFL